MKEPKILKPHRFPLSIWAKIEKHSEDMGVTCTAFIMSAIHFYIKHLNKK
jgi:hypothetical protein